MHSSAGQISKQISSTTPVPDHAHLQANDPMTAVDMREILLKLAHRLILASWKPSEAHADRLYLYVTILQQVGLYKDARELLETDSGRFLCSRSLACDYIRRDVMKAGGWQKEEAEVAEQRIVEKRSGMSLRTGLRVILKFMQRP